VEPTTSCEEKRWAIPTGSFFNFGGSFVLPALTFDFCERDDNYRLTLVARRRALCFPKWLATVFHIAPGT
jgi:hypothetical protein